MVALLCENSKNSKWPQRFETTSIMLMEILSNMWQLEFPLRVIVPELSPNISKKCKSSPFRGFRAIDSKMTENLKSWRNLRRNLFETMPIVFPVILSTIIEVFGKKNFLKKFPWAMDLVFFKKIRNFQSYPIASKTLLL